MKGTSLSRQSFCNHFIFFFKGKYSCSKTDVVKGKADWRVLLIKMTGLFVSYDIGEWTRQKNSSQRRTAETWRISVRSGFEATFLCRLPSWLCSLFDYNIRIQRRFGEGPIKYKKQTGIRLMVQLVKWRLFSSVGIQEIQTDERTATRGQLV